MYTVDTDTQNSDTRLSRKNRIEDEHEDDDDDLTGFADDQIIVLSLCMV